MATKVKSFCRNCTGSCGLELEVENNTILSAKGDQDHPVIQGYH